MKGFVLGGTMPPLSDIELKNKNVGEKNQKNARNSLDLIQT